MEFPHRRNAPEFDRRQFFERSVTRSRSCSSRDGAPDFDFGRSVPSDDGNGQRPEKQSRKTSPPWVGAWECLSDREEWLLEYATHVDAWPANVGDRTQWAFSGEPEPYFQMMPEANWTDPLGEFRRQG